jgi:hypothetical protein
MRKILVTYIPASLFLAFLVMGIFTLGGCGGDGGGELSSNNEIQPALPAPGVTLTGLSINGPSSMGEYESASYTALASWSDGSTSMVTPTWSVYPQKAEIDTDGVLSCRGGVASDQMVTVRAAYSSGGIAKSDTMDVTITNVPTIPFTGEEVSAKAFFQEDSRGDYTSFLYILNADSSLNVYWNFGLPRGDGSSYMNGTWSNDPDGLFLDFRLWGMGPAMVHRTADSPTDMEVLLYQAIWRSSTVATWEKTVPVDPAKLPGTYAGSDGYTWVFNADETGSVPDFGVGGLTFTWSVDAEGVLRMPSSTGYTPVFYARATSQSTATEYTILKVGFVELTPTGAFFKYYGGIELTRQ